MTSQNQSFQPEPKLWSHIWGHFFLSSIKKKIKCYHNKNNQVSCIYLNKQDSEYSPGPKYA